MSRTDLAKIDSELEPLITNLIHIVPKTSAGYQIMKREATEFKQKITKALDLAKIIVDAEKVMSKVSRSGVKSLMKMFQYLAYVESLGATLIDVLVLMVIASGHQLHVERHHGWPHILHVSSFKELSYSNLASKLGFLKLNGLKNVVKVVNRELRNDVAHLNFSIDGKGRINTSHKKNLNIDKEILELKVHILYIDALLGKFGFKKWVAQI